MGGEGAGKGAGWRISESSLHLQSECSPPITVNLQRGVLVVSLV